MNSDKTCPYCGWRFDSIDEKDDHQAYCREEKPVAFSDLPIRVRELIRAEAAHWQTSDGTPLIELLPTETRIKLMNKTQTGK